MNRKSQSELLKARRLQFVRYVTRSRTDTEIFEEVGIPKRAVCRFATTLTGKGIIIHSEPNHPFGRHYWLAIALVDAERIIDPPVKKRMRQEHDATPPLPVKPWYIISDNPACMPKEPS